MIQERLTFENSDEPNLIESYKIMNKNLRRKIKEKDIKIMQLFNCIDEASRQISKSPQSQIKQSDKYRQRNVKLTMSQNSKKGKQNFYQSNLQSSNIFKEKSFSLISKESKKELRLPTLEKKNKFIYPNEDSINQNPETKSKIIRIPLDRLKPLNSKEVKKRFLMKYQRKDDPQQQL